MSIRVLRSSLKFLGICLGVILPLLIVSGSASPREMIFLPGGNDTRCAECAFIQAVGEITTNTPTRLRAFLDTHEFAPTRIRLHSRGGNLAEAIALGEMLRGLGFATEVGSDRADQGGHPAFGGRASVRVAGECASACAFAFMGGLERRIEIGSKLGLHRFYRADALPAPTERLFTGVDLDSAQRITAALVLYVIRMDIDARVISVAAEAGPDEMRWVDLAEADALRLSFVPDAWKPWQIVPSGDGIAAVSETQDGRLSMNVSCTLNGGAEVVLSETLSRQDLEQGWHVAEWFEQNRTCPVDGLHPVFGVMVPPEEVFVTPRATGASITFKLGHSTPRLDSPAIFPYGDAYPSACSTERYGGNAANLRRSVKLALRNCVDQ